MGHFSSMFNGLARSLLIRGTRHSRSNCGNCDGREAVEAMAKDAKKNDLILRTSGIVNADGSKNLASVFSKRGEKGVNQDCCIVWEVYSLKCWISLYLAFSITSCLFAFKMWLSFEPSCDRYKPCSCAIMFHF